MYKKCQRFFLMGDNFIFINILAVMIGDGLGLGIGERDVFSYKVKAMLLIGAIEPFRDRRNGASI
jgi:hypothetical protein